MRGEDLEKIFDSIIGKIQKNPEKIKWREYDFEDIITNLDNK